MTAPKSGTGELRTDTEPLTKRFSVLGPPMEAQWMSGTYGNPELPGPSTYWIDAVITLKPAQVEAIISTYSPEPTGHTPTVVDGMTSHLPPGPFHSSDALDSAFNEGRWRALASLDPYAGKLVLVATGT